jgi:hypothetical protein
MHANAAPAWHAEVGAASWGTSQSTERWFSLGVLGKAKEQQLCREKYSLTAFER